MCQSVQRPVDRARSRRRARLLFLLLCLPAAEAASWVLGRALQARWAMYVDPVRGSGCDYPSYLRERDPVLGWPGPGSDRYEPDGSTPVPANRVLAGEELLVSLYGDSFTWGLNHGTPPAEAWANLLALELGRRVENRGVPGYGTDQAYLRYLLDGGRERARVAVLCHMTEDLARNLTRLRDLTGGGKQELAFKPRFVLDERGELRLVPIPRLSQAEYRRFLALEEPQLVLPHESFAPGGPMGATRLEFPFSLALVRNRAYWRFNARVGRYPDIAPLYRPDHPLQGLQLTRAILRGFAREAARRGQRALVVLFPGPADARWMQRTGQDVQEGLARGLSADGVRVLRFTPLLLRHLGARPAGEAFHEGHFVREINPLVAEAVLRELRAMGVYRSLGAITSTR